MYVSYSNERFTINASGFDGVFHREDIKGMADFIRNNVLDTGVIISSPSLTSNKDMSHVFDEVLTLTNRQSPKKLWLY